MRSACMLLAGLVACGPGPTGGPPRLASAEGVDPFVLERVETALAACARGEPGAQLELAKVYDANGLNELAVETYALCLRAADLAASQRATLEFLRAQALEGLGRADEALAGYDAALALGDEFGPTHWRRGQLLLEAGRIPEARTAFEAARALEPLSVPATLGLARVRLLEEDPRAALALLAPLAERSPDERFVHGLLARAHGALGEVEAAAAALAREERATQISVSDPRSAEVRTRATGVLVGLRRANEALASGRAPAALEILAPLHQRCPEDLAVLQLYGKALVQAGQDARAIELLEGALRLHPDQFKLELFLGLALASSKANKKALAHLARAQELNPAYGPTLAALGELRMKFAQFAEAESTLQAALEAGEGDLRTRILLAQVQLEQRAWERARATAEAACAQFPQAAAAWSYLAEAQARGGDPARARASLAEAEKRNPGYERLALVRALLPADPASPR